MKDHTIVDFSLKWRSDEEGVANESGNFGMDSKFKIFSTYHQDLIVERS